MLENDLIICVGKILNPLLPSPTIGDEESDDLKHRCVRIIIPSNIYDIRTRLEVLLEPKLTDHTDILTEASNLKDELQKKGEMQNEQQYRNALDTFRSKWSFLVTFGANCFYYKP